MLMGSRTALLPIGMRLDEPTEGDDMNRAISVGVVHTIRRCGKQADIIVMVPVHAGNADEYMVRFDGPEWGTVDNRSQRFKTLDAAKLYATRVLFGGQ
jgi:hypothetical protein